MRQLTTNPMMAAATEMNALPLRHRLVATTMNAAETSGNTRMNQGKKEVMTLTTPGCPLHSTIEASVTQTLLSLRGVQSADVQIVWDPPWTPALIDATTAATLGLR